jgi:hypothetical protein
MYRTQVIQKAIDHLQATSYLEIGVCGGKNFKENVTYLQETSDFFFENFPYQRYDVIFIDGLHTKEQAWKDFLNALTVLNPGGAVIFHDCNPTSEAMQRVPQTQKRWTGDVWKCWVNVVELAYDFSLGETYCVEGDYGLGVLLTDRDASVKTFLELNNLQSTDYPDWVRLDYDELIEDRIDLLHLISDAELNLLTQ